jgi:hypothetical protein
MNEVANITPLASANGGSTVRGVGRALRRRDERDRTEGEEHPERLGRCDTLTARDTDRDRDRRPDHGGQRRGDAHRSRRQGQVEHPGGRGLGGAAEGGPGERAGFGHSASIDDRRDQDDRQAERVGTDEDREDMGPPGRESAGDVGYPVDQRAPDTVASCGHLSLLGSAGEASAREPSIGETGGFAIGRCPTRWSS